jgi:nucleoside-diphosphate-sugar epimerase
VKRVLVTGATGFVGGRLAEILTDMEVETVCMVRTWGAASRLARLPVRLVGGDMTDLASVRQAMSGCDVIMHCALDNRTRGRTLGRSSSSGTRNVMQAALEHGVSRVVHVSSAAVHGLAPPSQRAIGESHPLGRTGHDYCDAKVAGERVAVEYHRRHRLPVSILRPTLVYGPFGYYSEAPARLAREGRLALVDGAEGLCNCVYVDNLVQAMLLAATEPAAIGEAFYVSDARALKWREYLERHAAALEPEVPAPRVVTRRELAAARRRLRNGAFQKLLSSSAVYLLGQLRDRGTKQGVLYTPGATAAANAAKWTLGRLPATARNRLKGSVAKAKTSATAGAPPRPMTPIEATSFSAFSNVRFPIGKAERLLGYVPAIDFEEGMARTEAWIRWARI